MNIEPLPRHAHTYLDNGVMWYGTAAVRIGWDGQLPLAMTHRAEWILLTIPVIYKTSCHKILSQYL